MSVTTPCRARSKPRSRWPAPPPPTTAEIRQRVHRAMVSESELLLAPEFFTTWAADHPSVAGLDIQVKRGSADNELNRYRYDVIIHKTPTPVRSLAAAPTWAWAHCAGLSGLHTRLISRTSRRRAHHRDPSRRTDHRRPHRSTPWPPGYPWPTHSPKPRQRDRPTPSPPNNCTASAKPPDTTSPSPGAPNPAPSMPSSSPPRDPDPRAHPAADRHLPAPRRGPPPHHPRQ